MDRTQEKHTYTHTGVNLERVAEVEYFEINQFKNNLKKRLRIKRKNDVAVVMFDPYNSPKGSGRTEQQRCFEVPFHILEGLVKTLRD